MNELWQSLCRRAGLELSREQDAALWRYIDLLLAANQRMNLTRIDSRDAAAVGHVGDALTLLPFLAAGRMQLADVGSGGGVPGIPLAIARPNLNVTLFESTQKKAVFLNDTVEKLALENVVVVAGRAEDLARSAPYDPRRSMPEKSSLRESFDVVTARALAEMNVLVEWCLPLVKVGGQLLAMKGGKIAAELPAAGNAIKLLGGGVPRVHPADLPGADYHVIVEVPKISGSDLKYPRETAVIRQKPL